MFMKMEAFILETGLTTNVKAKEYFFDQIRNDMKEHGKTAKSTVKESILGPKDSNMKVITLKGNKMDMEP